jgi:hypothetical protein
MKISLAAVLALAFLGVCTSRPVDAEEPPLFSLSDPRGDDHGDGDLVYPMRDDLLPGDLDLLSLTARPDPDGTLFEAVFARPIAGTNRRTVGFGGGSLDDLARFGFYTLNLDIYIDTDRVPGSGNLWTLPGRKAEVDPSNAWEKAICLTPRPFQGKEALKRILSRFARREMKGRGEKTDPEKLKDIDAEIARDVEARVFFPTRIRVLGSTIRFLVPTSFLGGPAKASWSYVVAVSGADVYQTLDVPSSLGLAAAAPDTLMILPISPGRWRDRFGGGREDDPLEPPLVDIIVPAGSKQEEILKDEDPAANRPVHLPGVMPGGK